MKKRRARLSTDTAEINLVPMLDMVSLLVQVMLLNVQFGVLAEIEAKSGAAAASEAEEKTFLLQVVVSDQGYEVAWSVDGAPSRVPVPCPSTCVGPQDYDTATLGARLAELKAAHPGHRACTILPRGEITFEVMAATMDAVRARQDPGSPKQELFPEIAIGDEP